MHIKCQVGELCSSFLHTSNGPKFVGSCPYTHLKVLHLCLQIVALSEKCLHEAGGGLLVVALALLPALHGQQQSAAFGGLLGCVVLQLRGQLHHRHQFLLVLLNGEAGFGLLGLCCRDLRVDVSVELVDCLLGCLAQVGALVGG